MLCCRTFVLLFSLHATSIVAPNPIGWEENSAAVGRDVSLRCTGSFPPGFEYLNNPNTDPDAYGLDGPHYNSLVALCAHEDWGGRRRSAGGKCSSLTEDPYNILFDYRNRHYSSFVSDVRVVLYCFTKCWCDSGSSGGGPPLERVPLTLSTETVYRRVDYSHYPRSYDSIVNIDLSEVESGDRFITITRIYGGVNSGEGTAYTASLTRFTGTPDGRVKCEGEVPKYPIPRPDGTFYDTLLELCAAGIYGGNQRGNYGGICHSSSRDPSKRNYYDTETFGHGPLAFFRGFPNNLAESITAARMYCFARCYCDPTTEEIDVNNRDSMLNSNNVWVRLIQKGKTILLLKDGTVGTSLTVTSVGPNRVDVSANRPKRKRPDEDEHRRVHTTYINPDLSEPPKQQQQQVADGQQQCPFDNTCKSPSDCIGCACHVNPAKSTVDPVTRQLVFLAGMCGGLISPFLATTFQQSYGGIGSGRLGGRAAGAAEGQEEDRAKLLAACACNASYVSSGCCQTAGGLIWEKPELQLGRLA